jgi:transcriptional regulator with XRE-family HTH domain
VIVLPPLRRATTLIPSPSFTPGRSPLGASWTREPPIAATVRIEGAAYRPIRTLYPPAAFLAALARLVVGSGSTAAEWPPFSAVARASSLLLVGVRPALSRSLALLLEITHVSASAPPRSGLRGSAMETGHAVGAMSSRIDKISRVLYYFGMITPDLIRGARGMLGISQAALAKRAGISTTALNNIERGESDPKASTVTAIEAALESAGAEFKEGRVGLRSFRVGDTVKFRAGKAPEPLLWHAVGHIIEIEPLPILMGPVPRVRARIKGIVTAWHMPSDFEFALEPDDSFQRVKS